ncbi:MAG: hypothetical protein R3E83_18655 [Burkholderiaceae bacterium]
MVFGKVVHDSVASLTDVGARREFWMLFAMAVLVLAMGIYPVRRSPMSPMPRLDRLLQHVSVSKLKIE